MLDTTDLGVDKFLTEIEPYVLYASNYHTSSLNDNIYYPIVKIAI